MESRMNVYLVISILNGYKQVEGVYWSREDANEAAERLLGDWHYKYHNAYVCEYELQGRRRYAMGEGAIGKEGVDYFAAKYEKTHLAKMGQFDTLDEVLAWGDDGRCDKAFVKVRDNGVITKTIEISWKEVIA